MKRKLTCQMLNEWSSNIWIVIEFVIVSAVLWYICDYFYVKYNVYNIPLGFDSSHCYLVTFQELTDKSPDFIPDRSEEEQIADRKTLIDRLRQMPEVEYASYSQVSYPYNFSNSACSLVYCDSIHGSGLKRYAEPDFVNVFRYRGANGESSEQLAEDLRQGKYIISDNFFFRKDKDSDYSMSKLDKRKIYSENDSAFGDKIGTAVFPVRYSETSFWSKFLLEPVAAQGDEKMLWCEELCIRVRDNMDKDIIEKIMKEGLNRFHVGNLIITDVESFADKRDAFLRDDYETTRNYSVGMGFLLLNIFLGLLGTFWFRTQQRVPEVALRKVCGASSRMVFTRLITEGLILLAVATPVAIGIDILIAHFELNSWLYGYLVWDRLIVCAVTTFCLMAIMVMAGIVIPALIAKRIEPAKALKDE